MNTYKSNVECKIANPDSEIVTTGKNWSGDAGLIGIFEALILDEFSDGDDDGSHIIGDDAWVICNPANYCSSLKEFLEADLGLVEGDTFTNVNGSVETVTQWTEDFVNAKGGEKDRNRFSLSAAALSGGCKMPAKKMSFVACKVLKSGEDIGVILTSEPKWTVYNNTMPLCELTDEQAAPIIDAWRTASNRLDCFDGNEWFALGVEPHIMKRGIYRIKPKSERELFIEAVGKVIGYTDLPVLKIGNELFDSGKFKYIDNTSHFGESI